MPLEDALAAAEHARKDLVLRNQKTTPPVVKIMNYKRELLKRLFKKLGKEQDEKDLKSKMIKLATNISYHDLENKKRQAKNFLKDHQILKFYMKVNIYDPENIQKGRMMLLNIAEDLKSDCKMTVSPQKDQQRDAKAKGERKPDSPDSMMEAAEKSKQRRDEFVAIQYDEGEDGYDSELENQPQFLYMELKSTTSFKDVDIDAMLEHTTFEDFMKGLYANKVAKTTTKSGQTDFEQMWTSVMGNEAEEETERLGLNFEEEQGEQVRGQSYMEQQALANIRERRKRMAMSSIFDGSEKKGHQAEKKDKDLSNQIDLTEMAESRENELLQSIDDELDILEAYIDPFDLKTQLKKHKLKEEIKHEKAKIKCKYLFKYGRQESDPFKLWS